MRNSQQAAMNTDWSVYHVTDSSLSGGVERVPEVVSAVVAGGASVIRVRDKHIDDERFLKLVTDIRARLVNDHGVEAAENVALFVNDRLEVAQELGCHLHVGQSDTPTAEARKALGDDVMIGLSTSTKDHVRQAVLDGHADVIGVGPVWATDTKPDADAPLAPGGVAELCALRDQHSSDLYLPAVAIGGITLDNAHRLRSTGIDGICVVSALATAGDPTYVTKQLRKVMA